MDKNKLDYTIESISERINNECSSRVGNEKEILMLSRALAELVSVRASLPTT